MNDKYIFWFLLLVIMAGVAGYTTLVLYEHWWAAILLWILISGTSMGSTSHTLCPVCKRKSEVPF